MNQVGNTADRLKLGNIDLVLREEAYCLSQQIFGDNSDKAVDFTNRLLDIYSRAQDKDFLLVHNPGGWGNTHLEQCLQWERSIIDGVNAALEKLGYTPLLIQHFRTNSGLRECAQDLKDQVCFFTSKARVLAAEIAFLTQHLNNLKIMFIGVSQGAAFSNAVMQHLTKLHQVYSIELGTFFVHMPHRVITERTLAIDSNGIMIDAVVQKNLKVALKAWLSAPFRWLKHRLQGNPKKFSHCVNVPGHEYAWDYPEVRHRIEDFLQANFGTKDESGGYLL